MVGVGITAADVGGTAVGEAQADSTQSRRRVEKMRMSVNIIQRIPKVPLQLGGSVKDPSSEGSKKIQCACLRCGLCSIMHPQLAKDLFDIPAHGADCEQKFAGNFRVGVTLRHQL